MAKMTPWWFRGDDGADQYYVSPEEERAWEDAEAQEEFEIECHELADGKCPDLEDLEAELWTYTLNEAA